MSTVKLADVKAHLNMSGTSNDTALQGMLDAAEAAIEARCGPLGSVARTQRTTGPGGALVLEVTPVVSITSLTPVGGTAYDASALAALDVDTLAGTVTRTSSGFGAGRYDIAYQAGRAELPADLRLAVLELVRHFWNTQRGPTGRPGSATPDAASNTIPGAAYLFPFRVEQLLAPHEQPFGFA